MSDDPRPRPTGILLGVTTTAPADVVQRHVVRTLVGTQVLGGVGVSAGVAVGALLAEDVAASIAFLCAQPRRVNLQQLTIMPTQQA